MSYGSRKASLVKVHCSICVSTLEESHRSLTIEALALETKFPVLFDFLRPHARAPTSDEARPSPFLQRQQSPISIGINFDIFSHGCVEENSKVRVVEGFQDNMTQSAEQIEFVWQEVGRR
jgi:hypothetical protein